MRIGDVSRITSGHTFRGKVEHDPHGNCLVIQMKDIDREVFSVKDTCHRTFKQAIPPSQHLKMGDVLFLAKGESNFAVVYDKEIPAVASSVFLVLRSNQQKVAPEYLAWYLNQEPSQKLLGKIKEGTSVTNISKAALESFEIKLPSLFVQIRLTNLYKLWQIEKAKTLEMIKAKDTFYNNLVMMEIEKEQDVEPFTDRFSDWAGYWHLSNYYIAQFQLNEPFVLKGHERPEKEVYGIIVGMEHGSREVSMEDGSLTKYNSVKAWNVIELVNLRFWNEGPIDEKKKEAIVNVIPHHLVERIEMIDRTEKNISKK